MTSLVVEEKEFVLVNGAKVTFSIFEERLLFIHGKFISGQYPIDSTFVRVQELPKVTKVSFTSQKNFNHDDYQAYYFKYEDFAKIKDYFVLLRIKYQVQLGS